MLPASASRSGSGQLVQSSFPLASAGSHAGSHVPGFPVSPRAETEQGQDQPAQLRELSECKAFIKNKIWEPSLVTECLLSICKGGPGSVSGSAQYFLLGL